MLARLVDKMKEEELLAIGLLINDDLQKTFSRYMDLKEKRMPEEFASGFEPDGPSKRPAAKSAPRSKPKTEAKTEQPTEAPYQLSEEAAMPAAPATKQSVPKTTAKAAPAAVEKKATVPQVIFDILDTPVAETQPKSEIPVDLFANPLKPAETGPATNETKADAAGVTGKLNTIMKQMQLNGQEDQKKEEAKMPPSMGMGMGAPGAGAAPGYGQGPYMTGMPGMGGMPGTMPGMVPPMMNPQMMQYMSNVASFGAMSYYGGGTFMTNMRFGAPGMRPQMFQPAQNPTLNYIRVPFLTQTDRINSRNPSPRSLPSRQRRLPRTSSLTCSTWQTPRSRTSRRSSRNRQHHSRKGCSPR